MTNAAPAGTQTQARGPACARNIQILCYNFNQDYSCFVCGTTAGFRVYTASPLREVRRREKLVAATPRVAGGAGTAGAARAAYGAAETAEGGWGHGLEHHAVGVISMLFQTCLYTLAVVAEASLGEVAPGPKKVQIWDDGTQKVLREIRSRHEVKGVAVRKDIIAVVCEHVVYVYDGDTLRPLLILDTAANPQGLCVIASGSRPWVLCCPGKSCGAVRVQVGSDDRDSLVIEAHRTELACLAVNSSGNLVATASIHGTVVKMWRARDGELLHRLRRSTRPRSISSLAFREDDRYLAVASLSPTVHVFCLDAADGSTGAGAPTANSASGAVESRETSRSEEGAGAADVVGDVVDVVRSVVPSYFNDQKSCAQFRIPDADGKSMAQGPKVGFRGREHMLLVLHCSGVLYEVPFREEVESADVTPQECTSFASSLWFAPRPDFRIFQGPSAETVAVDSIEGEEDAWQLL